VSGSRCSRSASIAKTAGSCGGYFLPTFLLSDLLGYESNGKPVFDLTYGLNGVDPQQHHGIIEVELEEVLGRDRLEFLRQFEGQPPAWSWRDYAVSRFEAFTRAERLAIIRYLDCRAAHDEYDAPGIRTALASYWRPSAETARRG